jgi:hypothetical protein
VRQYVAPKDINPISVEMKGYWRGGHTNRISLRKYVGDLDPCQHFSETDVDGTVPPGETWVTR